MNRPGAQDPGTPPPAAEPADQAAQAPTGLPEALAAEHAAIFAYGPIGVRLDDDELAEAAREAERVHRHRRDELLRLLAAQGDNPPAPEPSYQLPFPVTDPDEALQLAVLVEERVAAVWRAALSSTTGTTRATALDALVDAAVRAAGWRSAAGVDPVTVPFPGAP